MRIYPGFVIPPIPSKGRDNTFLQKRKIILQQFLNDILIHPLLKRSELVKQFLSLSDKEWTNTIESFDKYSTPREVVEFRTIEGEARIEVTEDTEIYCKQIFKLPRNIKQEYKALKQHNKIIAQNFDILAESISKAANSYQKLSLLYTELEGKKQANIFCFKKELHNKLGDAYKTFKELFERSFPYLYIYLKKEVSCIEELMETQKTASMTKNNFEKKLKKKKEALFQEKIYLNGS